MQYLKRMSMLISKYSLIRLKNSLKCHTFEPFNKYLRFSTARNHNFEYIQKNLFHSSISTSLVNSKLLQLRIITYRTFKTSESRKFHPIIWIVFKPILKLTAVLTGRGFRKWWKDLPKDKKKYFLERVKANKNKIGVIFLLSTLSCFGYYVSHIEETPITKRKRFMAFNAKQIEEINKFELQQIMENLGSQVIPANHPATLRVKAIVQRILKANSDIKEVHGKEWGVSVIDNSIENAFVLPIGHVFVFTGMLKLCSNDEQLGTILAHEIAHCLQNHGAENVSFTHLIDMISILIIATIWAILPSDSISLLSHWLYNKSMEVLLQLPYSRKIETEADKVGLYLAAKACFDVRESSAFWSKMSLLKKTFSNQPEVEFLSTHPSHESRSEYLDSIMNEAIEVRKNCGCPPLKYKDPRLDIEGVSRALELARRQFLLNNPKPVIVYRS